MCGMCGVPAPPGHWSEAGVVDSARDRLRARIRRADLIDAILRCHGLRARDQLNAPGLILSSPTGGHTIAHELSDVWSAATCLSGRPFDPLDTDLLDALENRHAAGGR